MIKDSDLTADYYKSGEVAKMLAVTTRTIQNYCMEGRMQEIFVNGRRLIPRESVINYLDSVGLLQHVMNTRQDVIYARVSTHKQKERGDLDRQVTTIAVYAATRNPVDLLVIQDIGSGLNDNRKGLMQLLSLVQNDKVARIFINYKDRLTRFGFNYLKTICDFHHTEIVIVSSETQDKTISEELAEDIIAIIHSFSGKLYGLRRADKQGIVKEVSSIPDLEE